MGERQVPERQPPFGRIPAALQPANKRTLILLSHAMERAFGNIAVDAAHETGLVIGLFQTRDRFDAEAASYGQLAANGHTVIVGFCGSTAGVPVGVHAVALDSDDPSAHNWIVILIRGGYATSLVAHDRRDLVSGELTLEASRLFGARWTFARTVALADAREQLDGLAHALPNAVLAAAAFAVARSERVPLSPGEMRLAAAADHLVSSIDAGQRRAARIRVELENSMTLVERDQLTGLHNRRFLDRFLGSEDQSTELLALLVDVDDLKQINDVHGHLAGDAVLTAVASALLSSSRPEDVVVRWGGDEFVLLVASARAADRHGMLAVAERVVTAVQATCPAEPWAHLKLSVSVAICETERAMIPMERLDVALQEAKRTGKGRAALAPTTR